ncbi:Lrp/AsnC family transcriptional regulator [Amycolatopsis taiwanensis]|uniref:AsnC family transcriptional regulator n=1 Tax=Amycolatopsis taiwanensis TaxID=342230 RepID=A0A9W6R7F1_9PSEU|nr:Lrp/AsnC family transcriptional regulator [Amycolatopsis taiwanensis]GLY70653.1 AsnC family transcriptional regulator [Amycolatopsis taiwanensis]
MSQESSAGDGTSTPTRHTEISKHLNETDLALVNALQINPRAPWSLVGRTLGIGATTAVRRWQRLVDAGSAWMSAYPGGDLARRLGLAFAQIVCAPGKQLEVAQAIAADAHVPTVDYVAGNYDLLAHVVTPGLTEVSDYVVHRLSRVPGVVHARTLVSPKVFSEGSRWQVRAISPEQRKTLRARASRPTPGTAFTELDRALLLALGENGRAACSELATRLGVSASTVRRHVDALLAAGSVRLRCEIARGQSPAQVTALLSLRVPPDQLETTARWFGLLPEVRMCAAVSGSANLFVTAWLPSASDVVSLESGLVTKLPRLEIIDRALVLRPVKLMGHLLDAAGRSTGRVPLDFWSPILPRVPA